MLTDLPFSGIPSCHESPGRLALLPLQVVGKASTCCKHRFSLFFIELSGVHEVDQLGAILRVSHP